MKKLESLKKEKNNTKIGNITKEITNLDKEILKLTQD